MASRITLVEVGRKVFIGGYQSLTGTGAQVEQTIFFSQSINMGTFLISQRFVFVDALQKLKTFAHIGTIVHSQPKVTNSNVVLVWLNIFGSLGEATCFDVLHYLLQLFRSQYIIVHQE